jgi:hypothetical protein
MRAVIDDVFKTNIFSLLQNYIIFVLLSLITLFNSHIVECFKKMNKLILVNTEFFF